jgi:hypothetical protein
LETLRLLNSLHTKLSYLDILALSTEITDADRACTTFLNEEGGSVVTTFQRNKLHSFVRRFILPLHCRFACEARTNPLFHYRLKASLDTAISIISPDQNIGHARILAPGGGMFKEGIMVATCAICQELIGQAEAHYLDGTLHHRDVLKKAITELTALSIERIRQSGTSVKLHMLLRMILARTEPIEMGTVKELMVTQSARDSLLLCHGLRCTYLATLHILVLHDRLVVPNRRSTSWISTSTLTSSSLTDALYEWQK